jgi:cell wall-associated NlpC family hydrolase
MEGRGLTIRTSIARRCRLTAVLACSFIATVLPLSALAEEGIPVGSGAVVTAGQPLLVRIAPGWDAEVSYQIEDGSPVTVWDAPQAAPDGSLWYPIDGGFVPVDSVTGAASLDGGLQLYQDGATDDAVAGTANESVDAAPVDAAPAADDGSAPVADADAAPTADGAWTDPSTDEQTESAPVELEQRGHDKHHDTNGNDRASADNGHDDANANNDGSSGSSGNQIVDFAMQYVGYPYVYAGAGPYAFDCSGFTEFVVQNTLGIDITHDLFQQVDMGQPVRRNALQPGDLVFFSNTFRPGLSHTGIYIGDGQFVNAENESVGVVVSDLNSDYYSSRWYGAVRLT